MRKLLSILLTVVTFLLVFVFTVILAMTVLVLTKIRGTEVWVERTIRLWSWIWIVSSGCRLSSQGQDNVEPNKSYVVVANHLSNLDIMACFLSIPVPIRFLAKQELFKIPILAQGMRAIGIVSVDRASRSVVHERLNQAAQELTDSGRSVIIFPEGTRSRSGQLQPFKKGAFTLAVTGHLPILPVTINGTHAAWPPSRWYIIGSRLRVTIHPPIPTTGLANADTKELMEKAYQVIESGLTER